VTDYERSVRRGPMLRLHPKGLRSARWTTISEATAQRIDRWVQWRPDLAGLGSSARSRLVAASRLPHKVPLFTPLSGPRGMAGWVRSSQEGHAGRLGAGAVWALLRRVCARSADRIVEDLADWIHPHAIRAAVATDL